MTEAQLTIREMCDAFGVSPRTLRFYESKELLAPIRQGTRRLFTKRDRARMKLILRGKRFGFSLEDIRQLLDLYDPDCSNLPQMTKTRELAHERLAELERRHRELEEVISDLKKQLVWGNQLINSVQNSAAAE